MSGNQNWRTEIGAQDYFGHQQKKLQIADRRPVIRRASDLVGPGIGATAVRITNFNDLLATFDGFFSADANAASAPNDTDAFVGFTSSDSELGGLQQFTSLATGVVYQRVFTRNPADSSAVYWGAWVPLLVLADTDWISPTLVNGWVDFDSRTVAYRRINGIVHMQGIAKSGTVGASTPIFYLPEGFRPRAMAGTGPDINAIVIAAGVAAIGGINGSDGAVSLQSGGNGYVDLGSYPPFPADN